MFENNASISDGLIKEKARCLLENINDSLPVEEKVHLKFSNGWIGMFKQRNYFKMYRTYGEDGDADDTSIQMELPRLRSSLLQYQADNLYNADEYSLFYNMPTKAYSWASTAQGPQKT